jgi:hypothetical protein
MKSTCSSSESPLMTSSGADQTAGLLTAMIGGLLGLSNAVGGMHRIGSVQQHRLASDRA